MLSVAESRSFLGLPARFKSPCSAAVSWTFCTHAYQSVHVLMCGADLGNRFMMQHFLNAVLGPCGWQYRAGWASVAGSTWPAGV